MNPDHSNFIKVASIVPDVKIGNPKENAENIIKIIKEHKDIDLMVFPELCVTGYTCADLFNQSYLIDETVYAIEEIVQNVEDQIVVVGAPIYADNQLFNCAVFINSHNILGIVPKTFIPNYNEFYEKRWFSSSVNAISKTVDFHFVKYIPFGTDILFKSRYNNNFIIGTDICEDLWVAFPPSSYDCQNGATIIVNPSASNEIVAKKEYRKNLVSMQSAKNYCGYIYASAGQNESTTDVVFSGHSIIAENGKILSDNIFGKENSVYSAIIDLEKIKNDRVKFNSYMFNAEKREYRHIFFEKTPAYLRYKIPSDYSVNPYPFVPQNIDTERNTDILNIQATGLSQRLKKSGIKKVVIGISGGLDSTLAFIVATKAMEMLSLPMKNIIAITMPGFGTTKNTKSNSLKLMEKYNVDCREINIEAACLQHFNDIRHEKDNYDVTYENVQARERTQILMDVANKENAIVVGTGDLSELALGWCTYNGDHMSMYAVNTSIPKTLVKSIIATYAKEQNNIIFEILNSIINTPISPELLPTDKDGNIQQKTEESIGKYDLHDFFLYNMVRNGFSPQKNYELALIAFKDKVPQEEIKNTIKTFYRRFFTQQFKRSCMPDGVKVGSVSLSPRGDWRMPSDADFSNWII